MKEYSNIKKKETRKKNSPPRQADFVVTHSSGDAHVGFSRWGVLFLSFFLLNGWTIDKYIIIIKFIFLQVYFGQKILLSSKDLIYNIYTVEGVKYTQ